VSRPVEPNIPADEDLYRGLLPEWIDGDVVLPEAIDIRGTSVNRHKYKSDPRDAMNVARGRTRVASVCARDFPQPLIVESGPTYQFQAFDLPDETNDAHAEIRPIRLGIGWNPNHTIASRNKALLKKALADKMRPLL